MEYNKYSLNNLNINVATDDIENLKLLQVDSSKARLSQLRYNGKIPKAIINCSYFTSEYVIGRDQGDVRQATSSYTDKGWLGFAKTEIGYTSGKLNWWDVEQSDCGFTPATISILKGNDVELFTKETAGSYNAKMSLATGVTFFGIMKDRKTCLFVTAQKGLIGYQVLNFLKSKYQLDFLCELDGGGSTEMVVNGNIVQASTDGSERPMFNGLAFVGDDEPQPVEDFELMFPCIEGWDAQADHEGHALDFGWLSAYREATGVLNGNTDILACADGVVEFEGYYNQNVNGIDYKPIGVIIRHTQFSNMYDYVSIYWHLKSTIINVGDKVTMGQKIGVKGSTGISSGVHLHFTMLKLKKGAPVPDNHKVVGQSNWIKDSIDVKPNMFVYPQQWFKSLGNFDLQYHTSGKNEKTDQVEVNVDALNKRMSPSLSGIKIQGRLAKGFYDVYSETEADGYKWYEIDSNTFIAGVDGVVFHPANVPEDEKDKLIRELQAEVEDLKESYELILADNLVLENKLEEKEKSIEQLKEDLQNIIDNL